jgi:hypothetical protein
MLPIWVSFCTNSKKLILSRWKWITAKNIKSILIEWWFYLTVEPSWMECGVNSSLLNLKRLNKCNVMGFSPLMLIQVILKYSGGSRSGGTTFFCIKKLCFWHPSRKYKDWIWSNLSWFEFNSFLSPWTGFWIYVMLFYLILFLNFNFANRVWGDKRLSWLQHTSWKKLMFWETELLLCTMAKCNAMAVHYSSKNCMVSRE